MRIFYFCVLIFYFCWKKGVKLYRGLIQQEVKKEKRKGFTELPGFVAVGNGSFIAVTTRDLSKLVMSGDRIQIADQTCVVEDCRSAMLTLKCATPSGAWMSRFTGVNYRIFLLPPRHYLEAIDLKLDGEEGAVKGVDEATHLNTQVREKSHLKLEGSRATLEGSRATLEGEDEATHLNTQVRGKGTNSIVNTCLQDLRSLTAEKMKCSNLKCIQRLQALECAVHSDCKQKVATSWHSISTNLNCNRKNAQKITDVVPRVNKMEVVDKWGFFTRL